MAKPLTAHEVDPSATTPANAEQHGWLLNQIYDHPVRTGVAAAATAVGTAALLYYGKGLLSPAATETLLIEDTDFMGKAMKQVLEEQGHSVTWLTGVDSTKPFIGTTEAGTKLRLNLSRFKTAFVDGDLKGSPLQGEDVVGTLHNRHILTIGTSTVPKFNDLMTSRGADVAANKGVIFTGLVNRQLELEPLEGAAARLDSRFKDLRTLFNTEEGKPFKKAADAVLMPYMPKTE